MTDLHEATLAENILNIALEAAQQHHAAKIFKIGLRLGKLSGVEVEALNLSFDVLKRDTAAENAELVIERVPCRAKCNKCEKVLSLNDTTSFVLNATAF